MSGTGSDSVPAGAATARSSSTPTASVDPPGCAARARRRRSAAPAPCGPSAPRTAGVREPYGVWGGFTETERLRLLAIGWQDLAHRYRRRVDVGQLEAPSAGRTVTMPAQRNVADTVPAHRSPPALGTPHHDAAPDHLRRLVAPTCRRAADFGPPFARHP